MRGCARACIHPELGLTGGMGVPDKVEKESEERESVEEREEAPLRSCRFRSSRANSWARTWVLGGPAGVEATLAALRPPPGGTHVS